VVAHLQMMIITQKIIANNIAFTKQSDNAVNINNEENNDFFPLYYMPMQLTQDCPILYT